MTNIAENLPLHTNDIHNTVCKNRPQT